MTRKDYILIAEVLRDTRSIALAGPGFAHKSNPGEVRGIDNVAAVMACKLQDANPAFDPAHFLAVVRGEKELTSKPLAVKGLNSFRYLGAFGYVMIGAKNVFDAIQEAERSIEGKADVTKLEVWNGKAYEKLKA